MQIVDLIERVFGSERNYLKKIFLLFSVALNFHRKREQIPKAVSSRLLNKLLFFMYGTKDTFEKECRKLNEKGLKAGYGGTPL